MEIIGDDHEKSNAGRTLVVVLIGIAFAIALYFALGMPGMDHSPKEPATEHDQMDM